MHTQPSSATALGRRRTCDEECAVEEMKATRGGRSEGVGMRLDDSSGRRESMHEVVDAAARTGMAIGTGEVTRATTECHAGQITERRRGGSDRIPDSKIANMTLEWVEEKDGSTDMSAESSCTKHCTHLVHVYRRRGPSACGTCGLAASLCKHRSTPDPSRSLASKSQVSPPLHAPAMRARAPHLLLPTTSLRSGLIGIFKGVILGPRPGR